MSFSTSIFIKIYKMLCIRNNAYTSVAAFDIKRCSPERNFITQNP